MIELAGGVAFLRFVVEGDPVGKARPRVVRDGRGRPRSYTPEKTKVWEDSVAWQVRAQISRCDTGRGGELVLPVKGRVVCDLAFFLPRPKRSKRTYPTARPDLDNLDKAVLDALQAVRVLADDAIVTDLSASKRYVDTWGPGVIIELTVWTDV